MEDACRIKSLEKESSIQYTDSGGIAIHQTSAKKVENLRRIGNVHIAHVM